MSILQEVRDDLIKQAKRIPDQCIREVVIDYILDFYNMVKE